MKNGPVSLASVTGTGIIRSRSTPRVAGRCGAGTVFRFRNVFDADAGARDRIDIPADLDEAGLEEYRKRVEAALMRITADPE
jgi:hypothetical protein